MSAVARLVARFYGWLLSRWPSLDPYADPFADDPASGEFLADISEPAPGERVRGRAYARLVATGQRLPRAVKRRLP